VKGDWRLGMKMGACCGMRNGKSENGHDDLIRDGKLRR